MHPAVIGAIKTVGSAALAGVAQGVTSRISGNVAKGRGSPLAQNVAARAYDTSMAQNIAPQATSAAINVANINAATAVKVEDLRTQRAVELQQLQMKHDLMMESLDKKRSGVSKSVGDILFGNDAKEHMIEYENLTKPPVSKPTLYDRMERSANKKKRYLKRQGY